MRVRVTTAFESGRIEVLSVERARAVVSVPHDHASPRFRQWFAFDVEGPPGTDLEVVLENAGHCTWADGMRGDYRVYASEGVAWHRSESSRFEGSRMTARYRLTRPRVRFAYYPPYPQGRFALLRKAVRDAGGRVDELGRTEDGRPLEVLVFPSSDTLRPPVWVIAQQHPGEAMAGWFVEGLIEALSSDRPVAKELRARGVCVVPRMNPDGVAVGNHRTTPRGEDLNRLWAAAEAPREVALVRKAALETGATVFLDVHGDERLPWVFAQHADHFPGRPDAIVRGLRAFDDAMLQATPDFQNVHKYPYDPSGRPSIAFASNWAQHELRCPAITLEMPFSDHRGRPDPRGFFPARARRLGRRAVIGLLTAARAVG
ncbi:MAG: M14-type cytosolic carboxypeptidase [Polyangiaceae bacterium]